MTSDKTQEIPKIVQLICKRGDDQMTRQNLNVEPCIDTELYEKKKKKRSKFNQKRLMPVPNIENILNNLRTKI